MRVRPDTPRASGCATRAYLEISQNRFWQSIGWSRRLVPDLVGDVTDILFEHSPGRGHATYTADHTAFDVLIRCNTPNGRTAFVTIEVKYSEAPAGLASPATSTRSAMSVTAFQPRPSSDAKIESTAFTAHLKCKSSELVNSPIARCPGGIRR